ncbi:filamentous_hemagglutinin N-terminal domain-containing protein [Hexamita inflata]|uniref:Filamentous hemagglutinin N-terminal domain-containing protein n=2 Tax=Hexamita inflata TaxID=28002 RepID=A0AA86NM93_9EUKA|nr:filamentous hemagglutinin N-terminal domain-containing protein [Hexamita inflata]
MFEVIMCTKVTVQSQICQNALSRSQQIGYCTKEYSLSARVSSGSIVYSPATSIFYSLYTRRTQGLQIDLTYSMQNLPQFSLFGITNEISLISSTLSVAVPQRLAQGSLICFTCNANASITDFSFSASGKNVSGLVLTPSQTLNLTQCLIQFRLNGVNAGGLIMNASEMVLNAVECNISGYVVHENIAGSIAAFVGDSFTVEIRLVKLCANVEKFGQRSMTLVGITETCDLCRDAIHAYGLCVKDLENSVLKNYMLVCSDTFWFDGKECSCIEGQVINGSQCVNILESVNELISSLDSVDTQIQQVDNRLKVVEDDSKQLQLDQKLISTNINSLYDLSNTTKTFIINNFTYLQKYITGNFSLTDQKLLANTDVLDQRILNNVTMLKANISDVNRSFNLIGENITLLNTGVSDQILENDVLQQKVVDLKTNLISSDQVIQLQQALITNLSLLVECLNSVDQLNVSGKCYVVNCKDVEMSCSQKLYLNSFDLAAVTHSVISNSFTGNVIFTSTVPSNSFVDITDGVYQSLSLSVFQSQNLFTNIKIRFGTQSISTLNTLGSIILPTAITSITVNQMGIVSKPSSYFTINTALFSILLDTSSSTSITNLVVNLVCNALSNGKITLINSVSGVLNISGYQVLGSYQSSYTVAMIGLSVVSANVNVNQVSFSPSLYNVGNGSSYLFGTTAATASTFVINNLAVTIGSSSNYLVLGSIASTASSQYQIGGIIISLSSGSNLNVNNYMHDCFQTFSTTFVNQSGFLVGSVKSNTSSITIQNVCFQQNMTSNSATFNSFGLIGESIGNIILKNAKITLSVQGKSYNNFGVIGFQSSSIVGIKNLISFVGTIPGTGNYVGSIFGWESALNCTVQDTNITCDINTRYYIGGIFGTQYNNGTIINATIYKSNVAGTVGGFIGWLQTGANTTLINSTLAQTSLTSTSLIGGVIGWQEISSNTTLIDSTISTSNISGVSVGGIIGYCQSSLYMKNSKIVQVRITIVQISNQQTYYGIVVGRNNGFHYITNSVSTDNLVNDIKSSCESLTNNWSIDQCS